MGLRAGEQQTNEQGGDLESIVQRARHQLYVRITRNTPEASFASCFVGSRYVSLALLYPLRCN
jgi:hypothetical protein